MKQCIIERGDVYGHKDRNSFTGRLEYNILIEGLGPWCLEEKEVDDLVTVLQGLKGVEISEGEEARL